MKWLIVVFYFLLLTVIGFGQNQGNINKKDEKGRKQGKWIKYHEGTQKKRYIGSFKDDIPVDKFTYYYLTGEVSAVTEFDKDKTTARTRMYHPNGKIMAFGKYINQKKDSIWLYFNDRKEVISKENYINGKLNGENIVYFPSNPEKGKVKKSEITNYKEGLKHGDWIQFYNSGRIKAKGVYKDGNYDGVIEWYFSSGKVEVKGFYKHAVKNGFWKYYENDGTLKRKVYYRDGKVIEGDVLERHLERIKKAKAEQHEKTNE